MLTSIICAYLVFLGRYEFRMVWIFLPVPWDSHHRGFTVHAKLSKPPCTSSKRFHGRKQHGIKHFSCDLQFLQKNSCSFSLKHPVYSRNRLGLLLAANPPACSYHRTSPTTLQTDDTNGNWQIEGNICHCAQLYKRGILCLLQPVSYWFLCLKQINKKVHTSVAYFSPILQLSAIVLFLQIFFGGSKNYISHCILSLYHTPSFCYWEIFLCTYAFTRQPQKAYQQD